MRWNVLCVLLVVFIIGCGSVEVENNSTDKVDGDMVCGNGILEPTHGEDCDDGNTVDDDGCDSECSLEVAETVCGDGVLQERDGEDCDDGNILNDDGCNTKCSVEEGWECSPDCVEVCGNDIVTSGEECDDGNDEEGDGCFNCKLQERDPFCHYLDSSGNEKEDEWKLTNFTKPYEYNGVRTEEKDFLNTCNDDFSALEQEVCGNAIPYKSGINVRRGPIQIVECEFDCNRGTNRCCAVTKTEQTCKGDLLINSTTIDCFPGNPIEVEITCDEGLSCSDGECK